MDPACLQQAGLRNRHPRLPAWGVGALCLLGVVGCGVNDYLDASKQTLATLKQFDEDEKKLGGPAEIPSLERQTPQGTFKGPLLELCFRPPAGFNQPPVLLTPPNQPLKVLRYASPDGRPSGPIAGMWLVVLPGRDAKPLREELAKSNLFTLGEGSWDKIALRSAATRGVLNAEWFKPANKPAQPAPATTPAAPVQPANPKGKAPPPAPKAATVPVAQAQLVAIPFIFPYEQPQEPSQIALVYQPVPGMEAAARDLAMRSAATARTLAAAASERARLTRKKTAPGGGKAPPGAPGTPSAQPQEGAAGGARP